MRTTRLAKIACINAVDDIDSETGEAFVWRFFDGARCNEQHRCDCVWRVLSSEQLFRLMTEREVFISEYALRNNFERVEK